MRPNVQTHSPRGTATLRTLLRALPLALPLVFHGCNADFPSGPAAEASVTINAALAGTDVRALTIIVSGPAIATPIVANADVSVDAPSATLVMSVPVGGQRTFVARGFDASGEVTHEGMATTAVRPGANPGLTIRMYPRSGDVPIVIGVGSWAVAIAPSPLDPLPPGATVQLVATVTDASGATVPGAVVSWGSLNPVVASVSPGGLVTAHLAGTTTLFATFQGSAASVDLVVDVAPQPLAFESVVAGDNTTCALEADGRAWCWGLRLQREAAPGEPLGDDRPTPVPGSVRFASISVGSRHACGVTPAGEGRCWGWAGDGATGTGHASGYVEEPQPVLGGHAWHSISASVRASCGIRTDGAALCWGRGEAGAVGLSGDGTPGVTASPQPVTVAAGPWAALGLSVAASCGIRPGGEAVCSAVSGSLITTTAASGTSWRTLDVTDWRYESQPFPHFVNERPSACGLTTGGAVACWGANLFGETAGPGATATPTLLPGAGEWTAVSVGGRFACGLRGSAAWCWGSNSGTLGDGTGTSSPVPVAVLGGHAFDRIAAGFMHACALRASDGAAFCWGQNGVGELGVDRTLLSSSTVPVAVRAPLSTTP